MTVVAMLNVRILVVSWLTLCYEAYDIPRFNLTITSDRNETGHWFANVSLQHDDGQIWEVFVEHTTLTRRGTKSILINTKLLAPFNWTDSDSFDKNCSPLSDKMEQKENPLLAQGYELIPNLGYYKLLREGKTWHEAVEFCREEGAHLLIINSQKEEKEVVSLVSKNGTPRVGYWTGVHDQYEEGKYVTIFNETLKSVGYIHWYPGEPDGGITQNCVDFFYYSSTKYGLYNIPCDNVYYLICEKEI